MMSGDFAALVPLDGRMGDRVMTKKKQKVGGQYCVACSRQRSEVNRNSFLGELMGEK